MATKRDSGYHAITEIVSSVYCEQKMIFDRTRGRRDTKEVRAKREDGIRRHRRFERAGHRSADRRCFIATVVYGPDAPETNILRGWRDQTLMANALGRAFVRLYYLVSPATLPLLERHERLTRAMRLMLTHLIRILGAR